MNETLKVVLSLSLSGNFLILLLFLLRSLFKERLSKRWQYYIWLVVVARLLLPFAPESNLMATLFQGIDGTTEQTEIVSPYTQQGGIVDKSQTDEAIDGQNNLQSEQTESAASVNSFVRNIVTVAWQNLWIGWLAVALILFVRKITIYQDFVKYIRVGCVEVADIDLLERFGKLVEQNQIKTRVELYTNNLISSPLLIGFFRPCIILPTTELPPTDFDYTILHELMHFKRWDMFYKWLVQFTVCIHWFNPFVYLMSQEIGRVCELSCDEAVIRKLDTQGRRTYGDTLLNAIGLGGSYKDSLASLTLYESKELLKERLDAIMNFKKIPKWAIFTSVFLTVMLVCGFTLLGAYAANTHDQTNPNAGTDTVSLRTNSVEIIGFQQGEETTTKDVAINITEDDAKIQLNAVADGDSYRTLEVIDPNGEVVRTYTFNQDGFKSGSQEYLYGKDMIMVTDAVYPGTWYVRLSTNQTPAEKTSVTARLIAPFVWGFASDTDVSSAEIEDDSLLFGQIYDHYRTYEQTKEDIQNGYIVNTGVSFSEQAMPIVMGGRGTSFYVNHENSIDISITLKNLIDGTGHHYWEPITDVSFVSFEIYDPSGKVAYSFYREGTDIENAVDIDTELDVYPGEWQYNISFAYTTNGIDPSDMEISLRYKTMFEDDIQWLVDNKLNMIN
ncbi:MAG: M56 family metallopeptidase [Lachnospiraceae bacterium]|nr:M56 family metallopeptidase [Lachnospiraceae bacterium]